MAYWPKMDATIGYPMKPTLPKVSMKPYMPCMSLSLDISRESSIATATKKAYVTQPIPRTGRIRFLSGEMSPNTDDTIRHGLLILITKTDSCWEKRPSIILSFAAPNPTSIRMKSEVICEISVNMSKLLLQFRGAKISDIFKS